MSITEILFWGLSVLALFSAVMVVASKSPVHSILFLIVVFFTISGHYILLNAQFLAIVNIIVYAGAIMVLFLFVVMLMNLNAESEPKKNRYLQFAGLISGGCLFLIVISAISETTQVLFKDYVVPFEISSVLFLSAMIGAVVIGKKEKQNL
jgi:NADH-quinone oxidoreductase subunit J